MKYFIVFLLTILAFSAFSQRRTDPKKQLKKAPGNDPGYVLRSDNNGELDFFLLEDLLGSSTSIKPFRFSTDNFATYTLPSVPLSVGTAGFDQRKGCLMYYNGSTWQEKGLANGEAADIPWAVVGNDSLTGWNVANYNRGQLTISSLSPDIVWIPRPTNYLSQTPGEKIVVDVWNNQLADTLTVNFDSIFRKFNQRLMVRGQVPPKARVQWVFKVEPSVEGVAWINIDDSQDATDVKMNPPISFGGETPTTVQGALKAVNARLDSAFQSVSQAEWVARQKLEAYQVNPPVANVVGDTTFERILDAKYFYPPGRDEQRIYFVSIVTSAHGYRYVSSYDHGKTWNWGTYQPAFFTALGSGDEVGLHEMFILAEDSLNWKMYYQAYDASNVYRTKLATTSNAGQTWTRQGVVLNVGTSGQWDSNYAGCRNVIKLEDGTYYMAYEGNAGGITTFSGGAATSPDGITWTKLGEVVKMEPLIYDWETNNGLINYVQKVGDTYIMMYGTKQASAGVQNTHRDIGIAYSLDGVNYTKYVNNPIIDLDTFIVNQSGGWNEGTEDFISWEKVPGQEGAYSIITRGRPIYVSGLMKWNFGLYWFGSRLNISDIISGGSVSSNTLTLPRRGLPSLSIDITPTTSISHNWFVNPSGTNATSVEGNIFKQALSPFYVAGTTAHAGDVINVRRGTYQAGISPAFNATNPVLHGLSKIDSLYYNFDRGALLTAATNYTQSFTIATDLDNSTSFTSSAKRILSIMGYPSIKLSSTNTSVKAPFGFYNTASEVYLQLGKIENLGGGRNWGAQFGNRKVYADIEEIEVSGGYVIGVAGAYSASGGYPRTGQNRDYDIHVKRAIAGAGNASDYFGAVRYQTDTYDSLSNIKIRVDNITLANATRLGFLMLQTSASKKSNFSFSFGNIVQLGSALTTNTYTAGLANSGTDITWTGAKASVDCNYSVDIENITSPRPLFASFVGDTDTLSNSTLILKIKKGTWTGGAPFVIDGMVLVNNSKFIIDCEDCAQTGSSSMFWISNCTIDATSSMIIKGRYKTVNQPIVNVKTAGVRIENAALMSGTAAPIASDTASTNVGIVNTVTNSTATNSNVIYVGQTVGQNTGYQ